MQRKRFGSPQSTTARNDNYEPCIRLTNVHRIPRVSRHLDDILTTLEAIIGKGAYMHTYRRSTNNSPTTSVFIQLENWSHHEKLKEILNQMDFHSYSMRAEHFNFNFQFDDNEYTPKGIGCQQCLHNAVNKFQEYVNRITIPYR